MPQPKIIIVGGGVAAIAMAHTLKCKLGHHNFAVGPGPLLRHTNLTRPKIYEKREGLGGTWRANTYPGWYVLSSKIMPLARWLLTPWPV